VQATSPAPQTKGRAWFWPVAIITLLCVHALAMIVVVFIATRDPSFSVEPNSYKKAIAWDMSQARRRASDQLGWSASIQTSDSADMLGRRRITCRITDKDGVPVAAATVRLEVFHHARAADRVQVSLNPEANGTYSAELPMKRAGTWEFRIAARRGSETFTTALTQRVGGAS
jgi:nitrogen fixation protein FixH